MRVDKQRYINIAIAIAAIGVMAAFNIIHNDSLYMNSPDGDLYLSVAQNFIKTGHFIQTARPYEIDMVVPFGLPAI